MNKKDILLTGMCITIIGACTFKAIQVIKRHKQEETINGEEMVHENGQ